MMSDGTIPTLYISVALGSATVAALWDVRTRRIPNWLTGSSLLLGLSLHLALQGFASLAWACLAAVAGGSLFLLFYIAGGMGAGDVKLIAAIGSITGFYALLPVLVMTAIVGGVLALVLATMRGRLRETFSNVGALILHHRVSGLAPHPELNVRNGKTLRLPYAVAIAAGCLITLCSQLRAR